MGAVGSLAAPTGLLGDDGLLRHTGRTTTLTRPASSSVAGPLARSGAGHPWTVRSFSAGSRETLNVTSGGTRVVAVGVARDASGRWGHPARWCHASSDLSPA